MSGETVVPMAALPFLAANILNVVGLPMDDYFLPLQGLLDKTCVTTLVLEEDGLGIDKVHNTFLY